MLQTSSLEEMLLELFLITTISNISFKLDNHFFLLSQEMIKNACVFHNRVSEGSRKRVDARKNRLNFGLGVL